MGIWCYTKLETTGNPKAKNFQQLWHRLNIYSNRAYFRQLKKFSMVTKFGDFIEHWSIVALKFFKLNFCNRIVHIVHKKKKKKFSGLPKFQSQQVRDLRNQEKKKTTEISQTESVLTNLSFVSNYINWISKQQWHWRMRSWTVTAKKARTFFVNCKAQSSQLTCLSRTMWKELDRLKASKNKAFTIFQF